MEKESALQAANDLKIKVWAKSAELSEENACLRMELQDTRSLYQQLINEGKHECYEERRVYLLKSQIIQLERQILLLNGALSARNTILVEVENSVEAISNIVSDAMSTNLGSVTVERDKLMYVEETCESIQQKLYKAIEHDCGGDMNRPLLLMDNPVVKQPVSKRQVTIMDVCSGRIECINLKYVTRLESRLMELYRTLVKVQSGMKLTFHSKDRIQSATTSRHLNIRPTSSRGLLKQSNIPSASFESLFGHVTHSLHQITDVCSLLLQLSVIVPAAPWPPLQKNFIENLTTDRIIDGLPPFPRSKQTDGRQCIDALVKGMNYTCYTAKAQIKVLQEELDFHQSVYELQDDYIADLMRAIQDGCGNFAEEMQLSICKPFAEILKAYHTMKDTATEEGLREFLTVFRTHHDQISEIVTKLNTEDTIQHEETKKAISEYCCQYVATLDKIQTECMERRDKKIEDLSNVKEQLEKHKHYIAELYPPVKTTDPKEEYENITQSERISNTIYPESGNDPPKVANIVKRNGSAKSSQKKTLNVKSSNASADNDLDSSVDRSGASVTGKTTLMPVVDPATRKRGKAAVAPLSKRGLALKDRPEWNA